MRHFAKLPPDQLRDKALELVKSGKSKDKVAKMIGRHRSTIYRWCQDHQLNTNFEAVQRPDR